ncbi:uncharacterized protein LOC118273367 isoform X2 [Spodoptera frugiperda]|nr:uncharacterized protein LOC118273367 isoform X2 [Spodoptera frugiperda]
MEYVRDDDTEGEIETLSQEFARIQKNYAILHPDKYNDYKELNTRTIQHYIRMIPHIGERYKKRAAEKEHLDSFIEVMKSIKDPSLFPQFQELQAKIRQLNAKSHRTHRSK